jgi:hypothetical protein
MIDNKFDINTILKNLSEDEIRQLNKVTQEKINAIDEEKARIKALKKNYALKDVPSTWQVNYENLGEKIEKFFKEPTQIILDVSSFYELRKQCSYEVKPSKTEIYCCPECGDDNLRVGKYDCGLTYKYAVTCDSCDFTIEENDCSESEAWHTFHNWLIKNGYLDKDVKFQW